jgi:hypothetical protein
MPDLNASEAEWAEAETSLFWKFAQVTREEYTVMYREIISTAVRDAAALEPAREEAAPEEAGDEGPGADTEEPPEEDE